LAKEIKSFLPHYLDLDFVLKNAFSGRFSFIIYTYAVKQVNGGLFLNMQIWFLREHCMLCF